MDLYAGEMASEGRQHKVAATRSGNQEIVITGKFFRKAQLKDEWFEDMGNPPAAIEEMKRNRLADIFTFWQRLPDTAPRYDYYQEWESVAAVDTTNYDKWWASLPEETRRNVRKAKKKGVIVREAAFDDDFVRGMVAIFNETPVRQGKHFWHYGKDFATVKREFSRNLFREDIIGAYCGEELIGFIMLAHAGDYAITTQIISKMEHKEKAPTNALIAAAVELCERKKLSYLVYLNWSSGSLGEFKRRNRFEKIDLPRYYVPLNFKGTIAIKLRLHHGLRGMVPAKLAALLVGARKKIVSKRACMVNPA